MICEVTTRGPMSGHLEHRPCVKCLIWTHGSNAPQQIGVSRIKFSNGHLAERTRYSLMT